VAEAVARSIASIASIEEQLTATRADLEAARSEVASLTTARDTALSPINKVFGRRFELVSLRWLNADEI
jgi:hypothetical protein